MNFNINFMQEIDRSMKNIMRDNKIDQNDIPELILLMTTLITSNNIKMTPADLEKSLNELYKYIMDHYKLYPDDAIQQESFNRLFATCIKLVLLQPELKAKCNKFLPCLCS